MVLAVIPARYASSRLPGKPLIDLGGETLVQRVFGAVRRAGVVDEAVVATDDRRILDHVTGFGGQAVMTSPDHPTGTDRVAEAARAFPQATVIVNVQGDEPFLLPEQLESVLEPFRDPATQIATLAVPIRDEHALLSPNVVKLVRDDTGRALYFSRHAIPYLRDIPLGQWIDRGEHLQHIGLYAFRAEVLQRITSLPPSPLEQLESLEQLRWLAAGYRIRVALTDRPSLGIDTPADVEEARKRLEK